MCIIVYVDYGYIRIWLAPRREKSALLLARALRERCGAKCLLLLLLFLLLLLLQTVIGLSLGGSSPYTSTDKTNKNKYIETKQYKEHSINNTKHSSYQYTRYDQ